MTLKNRDEKTGDDTIIPLLRIIFKYIYISFEIKPF